MMPWSSRGSKKGRPAVNFDPVSDVFEQSEKSLLAEAFGRPLGVIAILVLILAVCALAANHFLWVFDRVNDFAMVAFFVAGGVLLSLLLRSGEPRSEQSARRQQRYGQESELVFEDEQADEGLVSPRRKGLSEERAAGVPVPAAATRAAVQPATALSEVDDEVAGYERALLHYAERGDMHGQGEILRRLGHAAKKRGHLDESKEFYVNSRNCFKSTNDHYAEAAVLLDLGQVLESLSDHDAASAAYRDANRALLDVAMNTSGGRDNDLHAQAAD